MKPVAFGGRFGWLHAGAGKRGVVLCNTYGHEHVWTYRGMRHLADELSARGVHVLRFDYRGTGDSVDANADLNAFDTAVSDIHAAIDYLKAETGIEQVSLCGFRVGAAFAVAAALRRPVDELVLLAPVMNGRIYMRELSVTRKTWLDQLSPPLRATQNERPFNVLGQIYHDNFKRTLESIDLASSIASSAQAPAQSTLIVEARVGVTNSLVDALIAKDIHAEHFAFDDLTGFLQETAFSVLPERTYARAIEWMLKGSVRKAPSVMDTQFAHDVVFETPDAVERFVCIGEDALVGILSEPRNGAVRGAVYLLTNTSASARVGDSRLSVRIARELARRGIATLRYDARGRGDSPPDPLASNAAHPFSNIYNATATADTAEAARWLSRQGYRTIYTFGVCSGAYHALKAALIEAAITGVVAVNVPTLKRPEPKTAGAPREAARNSMAGYAISMLDPAKWLSVLRGEKNLAPMIRFVVGNLAARARSRVIDTLRLDASSEIQRQNATEPMPIMRALDAKGVKTVLVHGAYDSSMDQLAANFGSRGARLARFPSIRIAIVEDIDHALFNEKHAAQVIALCDTLIKETDEQGVERKLPVVAPAVS